MRVAVIAGTPVDTKMGVDFLTAKGVEAFGYPVAQSAQEQVVMQVGSQEELEETVGSFLKGTEHCYDLLQFPKCDN